MKRAHDIERMGATARVRQAQTELALAEHELAKSARPWQRLLQRHRNAVVLCGGFASGLALTVFPPRWWARVGAVMGATAAGAARSALTPIVVGAVLSRVRRSDGDASRAAPPP